VVDGNIENNNIRPKETATPKLLSKRKLPQVSDMNQSALDVLCKSGAKEPEESQKSA
jgi:hypothetical protein